MDKKILILIGKGKSTLINFFVDDDNVAEVKLSNPFLKFRRINFINSVPSDIDKLINIIDGEKIVVERKYQKPLKKSFPSIKFIIQLDNKKQYNKLPDSIKKRALKFDLSF